MVDAKNHRGLVERRDVGGPFTVEDRPFVGGRDKTSFIEKMEWQVRAVDMVLEPINAPVRAAVCFTSADWKLFRKAFLIGGVLVACPKTLCQRMLESDILSRRDIDRVASEVARCFRSKVRSTSSGTGR